MVGAHDNWIQTDYGLGILSLKVYKLTVDGQDGKITSKFECVQYVNLIAVLKMLATGTGTTQLNSSHILCHILLILVDLCDIVFKSIYPKNQ